MKRSLVLPIGIPVTALVGLSVFGLAVLALAILTPRSSSASIWPRSDR